MVATENIVVIVLMTLLFLRQFAVFQQTSKINYAPLILILGILGALLHLMMHPHEALLDLLREALLPLFIALVFYFILNVLNQTQHSNKVLQHEASQAQLLHDIDAMKQDIAELHEREYHLDDMHTDSNNMHRITQEFQEDITAWQQIQKNQETFVRTFEESMKKYYKSMRNFEEFTDIKMPEFDAIIHRHIEILRIAEQDHFNQIKGALEHYSSAYETLHTGMQDVNKTLLDIKNMHTATANKVMEQAGLELQRLFGSYETRVSHLHAQSESIGVDMNENALLLERLKERSEALNGQIVLVSKKMEMMVQAAETLPSPEHFVSTLAAQRHHIHDEIVELKKEIAVFHELIARSKKEHDQTIDDAIDALSKTLNEKIDHAISKLHEHYMALQNSNASTIKELASRSKMQKTYLSNSQE